MRQAQTMKKAILALVMVELLLSSCGYVSSPAEKVRQECESSADIYYSEYRERGYYWIGMDGKQHTYEEYVANCMRRAGFAPSLPMSLYIQYKQLVAKKHPKDG
jgi:hypothetical protein